MTPQIEKAAQIEAMARSFRLIVGLILIGLLLITIPHIGHELIIYLNGSCPTAAC